MKGLDIQYNSNMIIINFANSCYVIDLNEICSIISYCKQDGETIIKFVQKNVESPISFTLNKDYLWDFIKKCEQFNQTKEEYYKKNIIDKIHDLNIYFNNYKKTDRESVK